MRTTAWSAEVLLVKDYKSVMFAGMTRSLMARLLALVLLLGANAVHAAEELNLDFTLVNKTGYDIKEIYIAPTSQDEWSADDKVKIPGVLKDGESLDLKFHPKASAEKWDLKIKWADGGDEVEWRDFNLTEISKITLFYDDKTEKTTAETE